MKPPLFIVETLAWLALLALMAFDPIDDIKALRHGQVFFILIIVLKTLNEAREHERRAVDSGVLDRCRAVLVGAKGLRTKEGDGPGATADETSQKTVEKVTDRRDLTGWTG